jgi:hypothetical protein
MHFKATIQKVTDFGYFANFSRERTFEQSNWNFDTANIFSYYYSIYIFYHVFLSSVVVAWLAKFVVEKKSIVKLSGTP